jgi:multidrug efflux pump subunit AcrB
VATSIKRPEEEVDVRVQFAEKFRATEDSLERIYVTNSTGNLIPASRMASFERAVGFESINHIDGTRLLTVTANVDEGRITSAEANARAAELSKDIVQDYKGYQVKFGGENEDTEESLASLGTSFLFGLLIIFMILASLFRSLLQPIVVVAAVPFAFIGVIFAFLTHGEYFGFLAFMGIIGLGGVVVNDSIVLVDFANNILREKPDTDPRTAVIEAGNLRLRAVMLTTVTTVLGLLPTAYGIGGFDPFLVPMALAFSWGLAFSTVLTLVIVPVLYHGQFELSNWVSGLIAKARGQRKPAEA